MSKMKIKKGDTVRVITGKDKGKEGKVLSVSQETSRIIVEGVNMVTKHMKASGANQGGIVHQEAPIHVSNVMLVCPKCNAATRVGFSRKDGKVTRICKKCHAEIDA